MGAIRFSADPRLMRELSALLPIDAFVETGTYEGETVAAVEELFAQVHTIELSDELHSRAAERFAEAAHVTVHHGRSQELLPGLAKTLRRKAVIYWLDAHWCGPEAEGADEQCPLLEELAGIGALNDRSVVLIDDARLFLAPPPRPAAAEQWPTFDELLERMPGLGSTHGLMVIDDVLTLFPQKIEGELRAWARDNAVDWLAELDRSRSLDRRFEAVSARIGAAQKQTADRGDRSVQRVLKRLSAVSRMVDDSKSSVDELALRVDELGQAAATETSNVRRQLDAMEGGAQAMGGRIEDLAPHLEQMQQELAELAARVVTIDSRVGGLADDRMLLDERLGEISSGIERDVRTVDRRILSVDRRMERIAAAVEQLSEREARRRRRWSLLAAPVVVPARLLARAASSLSRRLSPMSGPIGRRLRRRRRWLRNHARVWLSRLGWHPRIGRLKHHDPIPMRVSKRYRGQREPKEPPTISVVTPSYNQVAFLERTIRSVLDQAYPRLDYVVRDGGSDDGSVAVLERYASKLNHWASEPDRGHANAVNLGMARTTGEILAYLNSDDILLPGALAYVGRYFERHPKVDAIYGHRVLIDANDMEIGRWVLPRHDDDVLSWADFVPQETLFWRRGIWEASGAELNEDYPFALDWDLLLRFRDAGAKIVRVPRFLGGFRIHDAQKTSMQMATVGSDEMERIRQRELDHRPTREEVRDNLRGYLRRHIVLHKLYRARILRY